MNMIQLVPVILFFLSACAALIPFQWIKTLADRLASDGAMERMTAEFYLPFRILFLAAALLFLGLWVWKKRSPDTYNSFFHHTASLPGRFFGDIRPFFRDLRAFLRGTPIETAAFWLIFAGGILIRALVLDRPLLHDEAYSIAIWGRSDLYFAISDYHLPNNHLFHTLLVNLIYHHIGKEIWMLRLPVFLSGILIIPTAWALGKKIYSRTAGLLAAGLCAFAPYLIAYSSNARGYEIQAFLTMVSLLLAVYVSEHKNIFGWGLLILCSGLNFFTLPVALYPFGGICVWFLLLVLSGRISGAYSGRWNFFKYLIVCGLAVSFLALALHIPLFKESGIESYFGNQYVGSVIPGTFLETCASRLEDSFHAFCDTWPAVVWVLIFAGNLAALVFAKKADYLAVPWQAGLFLWMLLVVSVQKPNLWPRTLLFLHPLLILWGAGGLCFAAHKWAPLLCAALVLWTAVSQFPPAVRAGQETGADERAVQVLMETEGEDAKDVYFVTAAEDNAPIWCYADREGLPRKIFDRNQAFSAVYALVNPNNDAYNGPKTLDELMAEYSPGQSFVNLGSGKILMDDPDGILYRFDVYPSAIRKAFGGD